MKATCLAAMQQRESNQVPMMARRTGWDDILEEARSVRAELRMGRAMRYQEAKMVARECLAEVERRRRVSGEVGE